VRILSTKLLGFDGSQFCFSVALHFVKKRKKKKEAEHLRATIASVRIP
jgi:hypothetical protein